MHTFTRIRPSPQKYVQTAFYTLCYKLAGSTQQNIIDLSYLGLKSSLGVGVYDFYIPHFQCEKIVNTFINTSFFPTHVKFHTKTKPMRLCFCLSLSHVCCLNCTIFFSEMAFPLYLNPCIKAKLQMRYIFHPPLFPLLQYL